MAETKKEEGQSIWEAMGIADQWTDKNFEELKKELENSETISEMLEKAATRVKDEEFGEGNYGLTEFEKKLMLVGFQAAQIMMELKQEAAKRAALMGMLKGILGKGIPGLDLDAEKED